MIKESLILDACPGVVPVYTVEMEDLSGKVFAVQEFSSAGAADNRAQDLISDGFPKEYLHKYLKIPF